MLSLSPLKDREEIKEIFKQKNIEYTEFSGVVSAVCQNETLGMCLYNLTKDKMVILYIEPIADIPLADGILRSTLHVAAEKSIMNAFYADTVPEDFLRKIDFIKSDAEKTLEIDKLFKSCCNCG
ncbi:MAG: hypothetical protein IKY45_03455 [Clostridia bacterium]|nr:hypothetical protein [Clostridia bacterium]